jgi:hypothetical protein
MWSYNFEIGKLRGSDQMIQWSWLEAWAEFMAKERALLNRAFF